jgi:uncharacterized protein YodC (DUF2158 family)
MKVGDVVYLNGTETAMTVEDLPNSVSVQVIWFDDEGNLQRWIFPLSNVTVKK